MASASVATETGWRREADVVRKSVRRWSPRILQSLVDQGLVSGANFAAALLLARWLRPAEYGLYTLTYAVLLFAAGLHSSLILEPMGYIGPSRYGECLPAYLGLTVWMHAALSAAASVLLLAAAAVLARLGSHLSGLLVTLALTSPAILLFWLFRRACYLMLRPDLAVAGSLVYAVLVTAGLACAWKSGGLSAAAVFTLMGAAGLLVSVVFGGWMGVRLRHLSIFPDSTAAVRAAGEHWSFGKWSLGRTALYWLSSSIYLPVIGALAGFEAVAAYRAAENLLLPMSQVLTALGLLLFPWLTRQHQVHGCGYLGGTARKIGVAACGATAVYAVVVLAGGTELLRLVYGDNRYADSCRLLPFLSAALVLRAAGDTGVGVASRAAGRPDIDFRATAAAAAVSMTLGLALTWAFGDTGAAAGYMASAAGGTLVALLAFRRYIR